MTLEGRVALVTGGSGDIGRAVAMRLGAAGARVVITFVGAEDAAQQTCNAVAEAGGDCRAVQLDQRDPDQIESVIHAIERAEKRLDIVVNNAAWNIGIPFPQLEALTPEIWDRVWKRTCVRHFSLLEQQLSF